MRVRSLTAVVLVWVLSLVGVAVWAQTPPLRQSPPWAAAPDDAVEGEIITGENIGFQHVGSPNDKPGQRVTGRIVVKIHGKWVQVVPVVEVAR